MNPSYTNSFGSAENVVSSQGDFDGSGSGVGGSRVISSSKGDVILAPSGKSGGGSKRRAWIIAAAVLCLVAVVAGVGAVVVNLNGGGNHKNDNLAKFNELKDYIEKGAGFNFEIEDSSDIIYAVRIGDSGLSSEISAYYAELNKRLAGMSGFLTNDYFNDIKVMENAINYVAKKEGLVAAYSDGGATAANVYIKENIDCDTDGDGLAAICRLEKLYYDRVLFEHVASASGGCYDKRGYDSECILNNRGEDVLVNDSVYSGVADVYLEKLKSETTKLIISSEIVFDNQKIAKELGGE